MCEIRKNALSSENIEVLKQLGNNALRHILLLWKEGIKKGRKDVLILEDIDYIESHLKEIQTFLCFHHYELLFSQNMEASIINTFFLDNFVINKSFIEKYNFTPNFHNEIAYYNNIFSFPIITEDNYRYEISYGMYVFQNTISGDYYGMQDNAGMLSINIFQTRSQLQKGNIFLDISKGQRVCHQTQALVIYTGSIFLGKKDIFLTCLQSIKGYREINFKYKFYRYILYAFEKIGKKYNKESIYSFTNQTHPCSWEENTFRGNYDNILQKRGAKKTGKYFIADIDSIGKHKNNYTDVLNNIDTSLVQLFKIL